MKTNERYQEGINTNQIRRLRYQYELRQTDMAEIMGFEVMDRICHWERGRAVPGLINATRLCILFNTDLRNLYPELYKLIEEEMRERQNNNFLKSLRQ